MSQPPAAEPVLAVLRPSPPRRVIGTGILALLGGLLLLVALRGSGTGPGWLVFLLGTGGVALWLAFRLWQATETGLVLTATDLRDGKGRLVIWVEDMQSIDRGVFAIKPAGGFTIVARKSQPRAWAPGLWWRFGRRIGIGGVTHRHEGRYMAEVLMEMLARPGR